MIRASSEALDEILGKEFPVLDKGFIRVVDYMGNESSIVEAARVSYKNGTKTVREDAGLINYLIKNHHNSPIEQCSIKFHIKLPIFVMRQLIRQRTAKINEVSARYSVVEDEFYVPNLEDIRYQGSLNKQGSADPLDEEDARYIQNNMIDASDHCYKVYGEAIAGFSVARETAREVLPVSAYTECYFNLDLHNLLRFISLRSDRDHAQHEIAEYSDVMSEIVRKWVPIVHESFTNNVVCGEALSRDQIAAIKETMNSSGINSDLTASMSRSEKRQLDRVFGE